MTAISIRPFYEIDLDHSEQLMNSFSAITFDPFKNSLYYFLPFLQIWSRSCAPIQENSPIQEAMMPAVLKTEILKEFHLLKSAAGLSRDVIPYAALNHSFASCGGSLSLTDPSVIIPYQHLFRPNKNVFTQAASEDQLDSDIWRFSDNEVRFLIARELGHIKKNDALLRIVAKIGVVALLCFLCISSLGFGGCALAFGATIVIHLILERRAQREMDLIGVEILAKRLEDPTEAKVAAISALKKMQKQNLERPRFYITKEGNNRLDFNHPYLTKRMEALRKFELPQSRLPT